MASRILPTKFKQLIGTKVTMKFREAVEVQEMPLTKPGPNQLLIQNRFVGINASDLNYTAGRYDPNLKPPYTLGFEAIGNVVAVGEGCPPLLDKPVLYLQHGIYSEYSLINYKQAVPVPKLDSSYVSLLVSGMTAAISLDKSGRIKSGETVLITAAAGGTGQIAVQWAKIAGCHVIGTCSTQEKADFLKSIGCDRPVIYTKEDLQTVLKTEYPNGVDVVYESVGGKMFEAAIRNLATHARVLLIGFIESYLAAEGTTLKPDDTALAVYHRLPSILIKKSASFHGFLLLNQAADFPTYIPKLVALYNEGKLKTSVDQGKRSADGRLFVGLESIADAVEYLYSKKSLGKIVVELNPDAETKL